MTEDGKLVRIREAFKDEIGSLPDNYRVFVEQTFVHCCPDYFWYVPAAMRGHHPRICQSLGGLVKHTRLACWWAEQFLVITPPEIPLRPEVISALLLHDICKFERPEWATLAGDSNECHGLWAAEILRNYWSDKSHGLHKRSLENIINAVGWHMGQWTHFTARDSAETSSVTTVKLVQLADYAASRKIDDAIYSLGEAGER